MMTTSYESELEHSGRITITIKGVSMRPLFHSDTDAIIVKKCEPDTLKNLDIVLFKRQSTNGMQYVLHRIVGKNTDGSFIIAGDNCTAADIVKPKDILGVAITAKRKNKTIKLDGVRYVLYKKLWCSPYKFRFFVLRFRQKIHSVTRRLVSHWRK